MSTLSIMNSITAFEDSTAESVYQSDRDTLQRLGFWSALATALFGLGTAWQSSS